MEVYCMDYRRLGQSGLKISELSFGSWVTFGRQVDKKLAINMLAMAYEHGVNFFDNAEAYESGQSEVIMGAALKELNWGRDTYCLSSKVFWGGDKPTQRGLSKKHIHDACHAALKRLQVDYLDLYFCHRPDVDTPIEETVAAMHTLVQQGKVLYWGTSEWSAQQIMVAHSVARQLHLTPPTMEQPQYNMFERYKVEADYIHLYREVGLGTTIWSPLASGLLTGKYNQGIPAESRANLPKYAWLREQIESVQGQEKIKKVIALANLAEQINVPLAQMAIVWCLQNPNVSTVLLGASQLKQLEQNLTVLSYQNSLTPDVLDKIESILANKPVLPSKY